MQHHTQPQHQCERTLGLFTTAPQDTPLQSVRATAPPSPLSPDPHAPSSTEAACWSSLHGGVEAQTVKDLGRTALSSGRTNLHARGGGQQG